jgi:hypothetical protein
LPARDAWSTYGTQLEVPRSASKSVVGNVVVEADSMKSRNGGL